VEGAEVCHHVLTFPAAPGIRNGSTTLPWWRRR